MPRELPPFFWFTRVYGAVGRTLALAGSHADALPHLARATNRCFERDPRDYYYYLGLAQEGNGDSAAACVSYLALVERWANVTPRSLTVERARERSAALGCE